MSSAATEAAGLPPVARPPSSATAQRTGSLTVAGLSHSYGSGFAVDGVSFDIPAGEVAALLGPSGCGKSTVLRAIAGLIRPAKGTISLGTTDLLRVPARSRGIGMVFQNYALFPHMTVAENVAYPLACQGIPKPERRARVDEMLRLIQLDGFARRLPHQLSGGQQQRVAVARALAGRPSLLLLDEPFGALDRALRFDLQVEMLRLQRALGITTLLVTHDQEEAQSLANRLVLMNRGRIEQIDTPSRIYDRPRSLFVNRFIGQTSLLPGRVEAGGPDRMPVRLATGETVDLPRPTRFVTGASVLVTCRPEEVSLFREAGPGRLAARLIVSIPLGPQVIHELELGDGTQLRCAQLRAQAPEGLRLGDPVFAAIDPERCHVFPPDATGDDPHAAP